MRSHSNIILITFFILLAPKTKAQVGSFVLGNNQVGVTFLPSENNDTPDILKIKYKTYLSKTFDAAKVNDLNEIVYLKYNLYKDEMEFTKNGKAYYMNKKEDTKIHFTNKNITYKTYPYKNNLGYYVVHNSGKIELLTKQVVSYIPPKPAASSYQKDKPADFKRESDTHYIKFEDNSIVEIPTKKKSFLKIFKDKSDTVKKYTKENKINIKKVENLKKLVVYLNTL